MTTAVCAAALFRITRDSHGSARAAGTDILHGRPDANIRFVEPRILLRFHGFEERVRSSHHLLVKEGFVEIINLQNRGGHAKPHQVRQVRQLILKHKL